MLNGLAVVAELYVALAAIAAFIRLRMHARFSADMWLKGCLMTALSLSFPSRWIGNYYAFFTVTLAAVVVGTVYLRGIPEWLASRIARVTFVMIFVGCVIAAVSANVRWLSVSAAIALFLLTTTVVSFGSAEGEDDRSAQDAAFIVACLALAAAELMLGLKWYALVWCCLITMRVTSARSE